MRVVVVTRKGDRAGRPDRTGGLPASRLAWTVFGMQSLSDPPPVARFERTLERHGVAPLRRERVATLQVNLGKLCNQACQHCHVDAGPKRTEVMQRSVARRLVELLEADASVEESI